MSADSLNLFMTHYGLAHQTGTRTLLSRPSLRERRRGKRPFAHFAHNRSPPYGFKDAQRKQAVMLVSILDAGRSRIMIRDVHGALLLELIFFEALLYKGLV